MASEVVMPRLGEGVIEGTIARWLKKEGDAVEQYEPILEIETDKVTTEATAEVSGTLLKIVVDEGETVAVDTILAYIGEANEPIRASGPKATGTMVSAGPASNGGPAVAAAAPAGAGVGRISPVVARIAGEHQVDLSQVPGTGRNGRITKKDILAYVETRAQATASTPATIAAAPPPPPPSIVAQTTSVATPVAPPTPTPAPVAPRQPFSQGLPGELVTLTNMRRAIADHMVQSKHISPHVTTIFEVDFSRVRADMLAKRAAFTRDGVNLTYTAYLVAATAVALKRHPMVNSSWSDEGILLHRPINIGMAAAIEQGLIVPVIKSADELSLLGLARAINDLTNRARQNQLAPADVQGGTFTITNHGVSGSLFATPIINQPQCGILGVGKIEKRVKVIDDAIAIRPLAYLSLTFDHRILDGSSADGFMSTIKQTIEEWGLS